MGGGNVAGDKRFVQVVNAAEGKLLQELELPARVVPCGLAAAEGNLFASLVSGQVAGFEGGK